MNSGAVSLGRSVISTLSVPEAVVTVIVAVPAETGERYVPINLITFSSDDVIRIWPLLTRLLTLTAESVSKVIWRLASPRCHSVLSASLFEIVALILESSTFEELFPLPPHDANVVTVPAAKRPTIVSVNNVFSYFPPIVHN